MSLFPFSLQPRGYCWLTIWGDLCEIQPAQGTRKWSAWVGLYLILYVPSVQKRAQVRVRAGQISAGKFMHSPGFPQLWFPGLARLLITAVEGTMVVGTLSLCRPLGLLVLLKGSRVTGPCGVVEQAHHILISLSDHLPFHQMPV